MAQSYQNVISTTDITTLNGDTLMDSTTSIYGSAVNTSTTNVGGNNKFILWDGKQYISVSTNSEYYMKDITYDSTTRQYSYNGEVISTDDLYVLDGNVGVFLIEGKVYTGNVLGENNEILVTAYDDDGNLVSV